MDLLNRLRGLLCCLPILIIGGIPSPAYAASELVYQRYFPDKIITLDPTVTVERYSESIILQIYDALFTAEDGITPTPHLAESYSYNPDTHTYRIKLREDVFFADGVLLTADDVVFTFERMCQKGNANVTILSLIRGCKQKGDFGVQRTDKFLVTLQLHEDYPPFVATLASSHFMILPKRYHGRTEKEYFQKPIGTGPFQIDTIRDNEIVLVQNARYFQGPATIGKIVYHVKPPATIYDMLRRDAIDDIFPLPPPHTYSSYYDQVFINQATSLMLAFRSKIKPYDQQAFREALRAAINNQQITAPLSTLHGIIPAHGVVPWGALGFDQTISENEYAPDTVLSLLKQAGYASIDKVPPLVIHSVLKDDLATLVPSVVKNDLENAGFKIKIVQQSLPELMQDIESGTVGMMLVDLTMSSMDTYKLLEFWRTSFPHPGLTAYDQEFDALLDQGLKTSDRLQRAKIYQAANRILHQRSYVHPIGHGVRRITLRKKRWLFPKMNFLGPFFYNMHDVTYNKSPTS